MSETFTPPEELTHAADAAESVLIWAEDAARRLLERDSPASAPELLQRVAQGGAVLRLTLSGPADRGVLLHVVEVDHGGDCCMSVPVPGEMAAELPPVLLTLRRLVDAARTGERRPARRRPALSRPVEADRAGIVFRVELCGPLALIAATSPNGTVLMQAACLREGPGMNARLSIH